MIIPKGRLKRIHVNKHVIASNLKHGKNEPTITIQTYRGSTRCHAAYFHGGAIIRDNGPQLKCGARVYIETKAEVTVME